VAAPVLTFDVARATYLDAVYAARRLTTAPRSALFALTDLNTVEGTPADAVLQLNASTEDESTALSVS